MIAEDPNRSQIKPSSSKVIIVTTGVQSNVTWICELEMESVGAVGAVDAINEGLSIYPNHIPSVLSNTSSCNCYRLYINATTGTMMQLSNDKPIGTGASQTATINNLFTSGQGPPTASGVFSYPIG